jgi:hypothetical protein
LGNFNFFQCQTHGDDSKNILVRRIGNTYEEDTLNVADVSKLYGLALENDSYDSSNKLELSQFPEKNKK